ncbi:MAG: AI-2E family transporter [Oscillospiraceae bacterium]|jgi:predicted PurR-regulated permease PerM|nr:AI-2E family transporter [Oscillospiraceae bacterium]
MKLHRNERYFKWGLTAFLVIVASIIFGVVFSNIRGFYALIQEFLSIISALLFGCLFAYVMNPVMKLTQRLVGKLLSKRRLSEQKANKIGRVTGVITAVLALLLAIYALIALIVPNLIKSLEELLQPEKLQLYYTTINDWVDGMIRGTRLEQWLDTNLENVLQYVIDWLKGIDLSAFLEGLTSSVYSVVKAVFNLLIGIVAGVHILIYKEQLMSQSKKITVAVFNAEHANRLLEIARRTNRIFGGYVMGKILDAILVGMITYFGMLLMGMPYAPLIATIIGVTNIIPFFGPFLGLIPSALLLLIESPLNALYFTLFILVLQQIDGNIIENRILGEKLGISDFWVLASILVFGGIFGFAGMLLGVPVFAVLYTLISDAVNKKLKKKRLPMQTQLYYTIRTVDDLPAQAPPDYTHVSVDPGYDMELEPEDEYEIDDVDYE